MDLEERIVNIKFPISKNDTSEDLIRDITRNLIFKHRLEIRYDALQWEIIKHTKCTVRETILIISKMLELGLGLCTDEWQMYNTYSLTEFAEMRGYMTRDEINNVWSEIGEKERKQKEISDRFYEKHGPEPKWTDEIWKEYLAAGGS